MSAPAFPVALGVVYRVPAERFEDAYRRRHPTRLERTARVEDALRQTSTWRVE
jgi:hypothetical protein